MVARSMLSCLSPTKTPWRMLAVAIFRCTVQRSLRAYSLEGGGEPRIGEDRYCLTAVDLCGDPDVVGESAAD